MPDLVSADRNATRFDPDTAAGDSEFGPGFGSGSGSKFGSGLGSGSGSGLHPFSDSGSGSQMGIPVDLEPGQIILGDRYVVVRRLGQGGMGTVWLVRHLTLEVEHALKLITTNIAFDEQMRARFGREAKVMARFEHPNAVRVHDAKVRQDQAYILMEYVRGQSLDGVLRPGQPQPVDWVFRLLSQIGDVLQMAHDQGIVHRDLKPSNLMLLDGRPPGRELLKVLDFGIAKVLGGEADADGVKTNPGNVMGTAQYASPEQLQGGAIDGRCDLYSLGVVLYEMLCGYRPFIGPAIRQMMDHLKTPPPPIPCRNPDAVVPEAVEAVVMRCLAKDPADRPQSALQLVKEFHQALSPSQQVALGGQSTWGGVGSGSSERALPSGSHRPPHTPFSTTGQMLPPETGSSLRPASPSDPSSPVHQEHDSSTWEQEAEEQARQSSPQFGSSEPSCPVVEPIHPAYPSPPVKPKERDPITVPPSPARVDRRPLPRRAILFVGLGVVTSVLGWGAWMALVPDWGRERFHDRYHQTPALHILEAETRAGGSTFLLLPEGYQAGQGSDLIELAPGFRVPRVLEPEAGGEPVVLMPEGWAADSAVGFVELPEGPRLPETLLRTFAGQNFLLLPEGYRPEGSSTLVERARGLLIPTALVRETDEERFVWIEGGEFLQGADRLAPARPGDDHYPPHRVRVSGFYMQDKEVSHAEIEAYCQQVLKINLHDPKFAPDNPPDHVKPKLGKWPIEWRKAKDYAILGEYLDHPAGGLPHASAMDYARWQNGQLPTEAQWEFAAKSGDRDRAYVWSDETEPNGRRAHLDPTDTNNVNTKLRGSFRVDQTDNGILDMMGSLHEWCRDLYQPYRRGIELIEDPDHSPGAQPVDRLDWVIRGGSFSLFEIVRTISSEQTTLPIRTTLPRRRQASDSETIGEIGKLDIGFRMVIEVPRPPVRPEPGPSSEGTR
ncbi:hypothetical protein BH23PLA1_BH23PLA1_00160 [soil metagenome]